jgi:hypothetical protein
VSMEAAILELDSVPVTLELDDGCSIIYFAIVVVASRREIHKFAVELDDLQRRRNKHLSFGVLLLVVVEMLQILPGSIARRGSGKITV